MLKTLIDLDRAASAVIFGARRGRPTISRVIGAGIGEALGVSAKAGTGIFHGALAVGAAAAAVMGSGVKQRKGS